MNNLSPAAQAVLNAAKYEPKAEYIGTLELCLAAALRALADQCEHEYEGADCRIIIRDIAKELEMVKQI